MQYIEPAAGFFIEEILARQQLVQILNVYYFAHGESNTFIV